MLLRPAVETLPFPFDDEHASIVGNARAAWLAALTALGVVGGDVALVARWADTALLSALAAHRVGCDWYCGDRQATPESAGLDARVSARTRAVVLSHPLGFANDAGPWREWCERRGLLLLEDAADALHATAASGPIGRHAAAAVFRLSPVLGTPDGAVLVMRGAPALGISLPVRLRAGRRPAQWAALAPRALRRRGRSAATTADGAVADSTVALLPVLADQADARRRQANFRALLEPLGDLVPGGWSDVPKGSSPLVFPIEAADPASLRRRLRSRGVESMPLSAASPAGRAPAPGLERAVGLPVHQQLGPRDLARIVGAARDAPLRRHTRLEWVADPASVRDEWDELAHCAGNPFATWRWATTWWSVFGRGRRPALLAQRRPSGRLVAVVALYEARRRPLRIARFVGHGPADEHGPACAPADRAEVGWALRRAVIERALPWDLVLAERMPVEEGWGSSLGGVLMRRESSPAIDFDGLSWDEFLRRRSRNFREQVRRRERKLRQQHEVRYRLATDPGSLPADLDVFLALHRARWGDRSSAFAGERERFHRRWAAAALRAGWLRLWFLELDDRAVAAWYGLRFGGTEFYYQAGRDPAFDAQSVGFVLLAHTMRAAADDGVREYRLLRGDESYKTRFASDDRSLETRAVGCSPGGSAASVAAAVVAGSPGRNLLKAVADGR